MRLNKYIAMCGCASRRGADELIEAGRVKVNGETVTLLGFEVRVRDKVSVDGKNLHPPKHFDYYKFYKPSGYITTANDEKGRKTIYDLIPKELHHLKPVGRLDKDSSGLIILTNDGELIQKLTHPSVKIPKIYRVTAEGKVELKHLEEFAKGIKIEGKTAYCDSQILEQTNKETLLEITLYQGLNRQIRKMFDYFGFAVVHLKRIRHATIDTEGLKKGQVKLLKGKQVKELMRYLDKCST
ncbi:23S rRNA pseudouridine2605 synthase [Candidatus Gastranaerophilus sp. (ex Termes propinquus)]|nr:23S rRNA pseudouridine2605 synthase [Candidatus Gastranaerophilus sp. (ex Termes propinquus)]